MPAPRRLLTRFLAPPALADEPQQDPKKKPAQPQTPPAAPEDPGRRTPTPAELWPPNRRTPGKPDQARSA